MIFLFHFQIGRYDPNSISHYGPSLPGDKTITFLELTEKAKVLCGKEGCNPGQRESLSENDISDVTKLYNCGICHLHDNLKSDNDNLILDYCNHAKPIAQSNNHCR